MKRVAGVVLLTGVLAAGGPVAHAAFFSQASAGAAFSTDTLAPPSALAGTAQCGLLRYEVALSWSATASTWADGYEVSLASAAGGPYTIVPRPLTSAAMATSRVVGGLNANQTYWFQVVATKGGWRSAPISTSARTRSLCLL